MSTYTIAVQRYALAEDVRVLLWDTAAPVEISEKEARRHRADLTRRNRTRNLVKLLDGIEFDTYAPQCVPLGCPELANARTRVTFDF